MSIFDLTGQLILIWKKALKGSSIGAGIVSLILGEIRN